MVTNRWACCEVVGIVLKETWKKIIISKYKKPQKYLNYPFSSAFCTSSTNFADLVKFTWMNWAWQIQHLVFLSIWKDRCMGLEISRVWRSSLFHCLFDNPSTIRIQEFSILLGVDQSHSEDGLVHPGAQTEWGSCETDAGWWAMTVSTHGKGYISVFCLKYPGNTESLFLTRLIP